jgi:carbonic anhydrase
MAKATKKSTRKSTSNLDNSCCDYGEVTTWKKALQRLEEGNVRYKSGNFKHPNQQPKCRELWQKEQKPWCIVLSCADSRVTPELVFDTGIGELFVIRVAGNIANASTIASIEYAADNLEEVKGIIVLGHEKCGAVGAALSIKGDKNSAPTPALQHLVGHIMPALEKTPTGKDKMAGYVRANARIVAADLRARSKVIYDSKLPIVPAYYRLKSGDVEFLNEIKYA